ncbi:hypothetical protein Q5H89_00465 [Hymenobacter sp. CA2-7]|nr:hypothetical protein [Hymenobacter sp. CA2-7]
MEKEASRWQNKRWARRKIKAELVSPQGFATDVSQQEKPGAGFYQGPRPG